MKYPRRWVIALIALSGVIFFISSISIASLGSGDGNLLKRSEEETCHACHKTYKSAPNDPDSIKTHSGTSKWPGGWGIPGGKYGEIVCTTCHTTHDTKNIYLIRETIIAPNYPIDQFPGSSVDFRFLSGQAGGNSGYYSFGDDTACYEASYTSQSECETNGGVWNSITNRCSYPLLIDMNSCVSAGREWAPRTTSTRVCEVCHSKNAYHNYDSNNNLQSGGHFGHNNADNCTACHLHSAGFAPIGGDCGSCHGVPPLENTLGPNGLAKYPDGSGTGSNNVGKHQVHAGPGGLGYSCTTCHFGYIDQEFTTKRIQIGFNIFGSGGGSYNGQTGVNYDGKNNTVVSNTGTRQCSNIYCHSSGQGPNGTGTPTYASPQWLDTATAPCGSCHKADGVRGNQSLMDSGTHTKHVASPYSIACDKCHDNAGAGSPLHVNYEIEVRFLADNYGNRGFYSQSPNIPGNGYGSCSNTYCHSIAQTNGGGNLTSGNTTHYKAVSWGGSVTCGQCHDALPSTGRHIRHSSDYSFECSVCHSGAGYSGGSPTANHVNNNIEVAFSLNYGPSATYSQNPNPPGNGYGTCSTTYCHSSGTGGTAHSGDTRPIPSNTSPLWSGTTNCGSCHGGGNSTGMPNYPHGSPKANSHAKHPVDCSICHFSTTTDGVTITNKATHVNRLYDLHAKTGYSFNYTYQSTGGSCSSISCHFNGSAQWGAPLNCDGCHAVPPPTGAHIVHYGGTVQEAAYGSDAVLSTSEVYKFNCGNCHPLSSAMHANGTVDIELYNASSTGFKANNPSTAYKSGTGDATVCDNIYCHSNGASGVNRGYKATPQWGSTFGANKCGGCHDNPPQYAGQSHYNATGFMGKEGGHLVGIHFDNIYTGSTGLATAGTGGTNSHGNSAYSTTISCYICHNGIVSATTIDTYALNNLTSSALKCSNCHTTNTPTPLQNGVIVNKSLHINAVKNVSFADNFTVKSKAQLRDSSKPDFWVRNVGYKVSGAYDSAIMNSSVWNSGTKTCITACHNNQPVQWGATNVTCNSCHTDL